MSGRTLHGFRECLPDHVTGEWEFTCLCGASFTSMSYGVAAQTFRLHMAQPPEGAEQ